MTRPGRARMDGEPVRDWRAVRVWEGMSHYAARRAALELGCRVEVGHRHGEERFSNPLHPRALVSHAARKDASKALVSWLRELLEVLHVLDKWWARRPVAISSGIAARTDPATSRAAGRQIRRSGRERSQALEVLEAIQRRPGLTTRELAAAEGLDRYVVARRVSWLEVHGLARRGAARPDRISGRTAEEWYPAEIGGAGGRF